MLFAIWAMCGKGRLPRMHLLTSRQLRHTAYILSALMSAELHSGAGRTALHVAAAGGHRAAVEALVRVGAHVSKKVWQVPLRRDAADLARKAGHDALSSYLRSMA